jgi:hypothetical protein
VALSVDFVGRTYPAGHFFTVEPQRVALFESAIQRPELSTPDERHSPPTFPIIKALQDIEQVVRDPELGLDWSRVVHGDQRFVYSRPLRVGMEISCTTVIEAIKSIAGNEILTLRSEFHDRTGELVLTAWATLVARGPEA